MFTPMALEAATFTAPSFSDLIATMNIQPSDVLSVLAQGTTLCLGLVFAHWGARKLAKMFGGALKRGRLRV